MKLAERVRAARASGSTVRGRGGLRIAHGRGHAARWLARLLRLPRASQAADTRLVVTAAAGGEHWHRTFDDRHLVTRQYRAGDGELAERVGILEFRFRLQALGGSPLFPQAEAAGGWGQGPLEKTPAP